MGVDPGRMGNLSTAANSGENKGEGREKRGDRGRGGGEVPKMYCLCVHEDASLQGPSRYFHGTIPIVVVWPFLVTL